MKNIYHTLYHILDLFYNKYYPLTLINRRICRKRNKKNNISILFGNCIGGYMYHQLGQRFNSPTINLVITDMFHFVTNLDLYLSCKFKNQQVVNGVPVAMLDDIKVVFTHYNTFNEACEAWYKRVNRINRDELFVIDSDISLNEEKIQQYGSLKCKKLIIFTSKKYSYPYCFQVNEFEGQDHVGNILGKTISGKWKFEKIIDWVGWINSDDPIAEHFRIK